MSYDGKGGIYTNNDPTVTSRLTQKRITAVPEMHWTAGQILKLAPDAASAKAAQGLLAPKKWTSLGVNEKTLKMA
jgi:hypothetical protein